MDWLEPRIGPTQLEQARFEVEANPTRARLTASLRNEGREVLEGSLDLPRAAWSAGVLELVASPQVRVDVRARTLDLSLADALRPFGAPELRGFVDGRVELVGGAPHPEAAAVELAVRQLSVDGSEAFDLDVVVSQRGSGWIVVDRLLGTRAGESVEALPGGRLRLSPEGVVIEQLAVVARGQAVTLSGALGRKKFGKLRIEAQDLDAAVLAALGGSPVEIAGRVESVLVLDGPLARPTLTGNMRWRDASVSGTPLDELILDLRGADGKTHLSGGLRRRGRSILLINGTLPAAPWREADLGASPDLDLELRADALDVAALGLWMPRALRDPQGRVSARLQVRGGVPRPLVLGSLELREGSLSAPLLGRTFAPISADLRLDAEALWVDALHVGEPGDEATLSGVIRLGDTIEPDLQLVLQDLLLAESRLVRARGNGELRLDGTLERLSVRGDLPLSEVGLRIPEPRDRALKEIRVLARPSKTPGLREGEEQESALYRGADIDLGVSVPDGSRIRGQGADLEVVGTLRVRKLPLGKPAFSGLLETRRGSYRLHGRRFVLRRGEARFEGDSDLDPVLDVEAIHRVKDVTIVARIAGRASDPIVRLESEPPLPEDDVLAYLLYGRSADEVAASQQAALESAAAQLAAGTALSEVENALGRDLPIDQVDVRVEEDGSLAELGVGGALSERLFIHYGRTLGVEPEDEVGLELQVAPRWRVRSDVSSSGKAGADVIWKLDY
jgi:translocation and assembly module TamB